MGASEQFFLVFNFEGELLLVTLRINRLPASLRWRIYGWMEMGISEADALKHLKVSCSVNHLSVTRERLSSIAVQRRLHDGYMYARRQFMCVPYSIAKMCPIALGQRSRYSDWRDMKSNTLCR
ncbi:hypothetical protein AVEN_158499-1 [Araneus ventricosus]|uniref:Uncharacterized protein n=1 Tax=Araneus ventricosus TaxID=182803 RepID=A0A4Y2UN12_ARAVE|nr:hypothetical protein AVEN_158499-1 [Araneus ventricosus]